MLEVGAFEAKNTLGALLDRVAAGEEVRITRHGRPVARLVPDKPYDKAKALAAAKRIREMAAENNLGPFKWEEWKPLRDEGRR
jgi:prevent-host-death family protein